MSQTDMIPLPTDIPVLTPKQALPVLFLNAISGDPSMMHGSPGIGKSALQDALRKLLSEHYQTPWTDAECRIPLMDVTADFHGLPSVVDGRTVKNPPAEIFPPGKDHVLVRLEELPSAPPMVQVGAHELLWERRLGNAKLPEHHAIVATGNLVTDRGVVYVMPTALNNRLAHLAIVPDGAEFAELAVDLGFHPSVPAFVRLNPSKVTNFHPRDNARAFASPRSWEMVSRVMYAAEKLGRTSAKPDSVTHSAIAARVGQGMATEFCAFLAFRRMIPSFKAILTDPANAPMPDQYSADGLGALYYVTTALGMKAKPEHMDALSTYWLRMPKEHAAIGVQDAARRDPNLCETNGYARLAEVLQAYTG